MLSKEQQQVANHLIYKLRSCCHPSWHWQYVPFEMKIGGYAGTGKTFLLAEIRKQLQQKFGRFPCAFVSFTGKASSVLRKKLEDNNCLFEDDYVGTIHSLIYEPITKYDSFLKSWVIVGWTRKPKDSIYCQAIFIDEASMVSREIWNDLKSYGISLIAVGDHGQLPPVGDKFGLLSKCDYYLTKIQRQALNSPIIKLAHYVRQGGRIKPGMYSPQVFKMSWRDPECKKIFHSAVSNFNEDYIILTGLNHTRNYINQIIREKFNYVNPEPYPNEKVVCLKNNHDSGVMNGQIGTVIWYMPIEKNMFKLTIEFEDSPYPVDCMVHDCCFGKEKYNLYDVFDTKEFKALRSIAFAKGHNYIDFFDFGYAISVHKSQGSEWNKIILIEETSYYWDDEFYNRWLYTAVTRAKEKLFIIQDF